MNKRLIYWYLKKNEMVDLFFDFVKSRPKSGSHYDSEAMALLKENGELKSQLNITKQALVDIALIDFFGALTAEKAVDKARKTLREIGD